MIKKLGTILLILSFIIGATYADTSQSLPKIVRDASNNKIASCTVKLLVDGWANQLYIHGFFSGNFAENESNLLAERLKKHVSTGRCTYVGGTSQLPKIVLNAMNGKYRLIKVKPWVDGWANQLYIDGEFCGNFNEDQSQQLQEAIMYNDIRKFPEIVRDAEKGLIEGCSVKFLVHGWANQLYLRGKFAGNFKVNQLHDLASAINYNLSTGYCGYKR